MISSSNCCPCSMHGLAWFSKPPQCPSPDLSRITQIGRPRNRDRSGGYRLASLHITRMRMGWSSLRYTGVQARSNVQEGADARASTIARLSSRRRGLSMPSPNYPLVRAERGVIATMRPQALICGHKSRTEWSCRFSASSRSCARRDVGPTPIVRVEGRGRSGAVLPPLPNCRTAKAIQSERYRGRDWY